MFKAGDKVDLSSRGREFVKKWFGISGWDLDRNYNVVNVAGDMVQIDLPGYGIVPLYDYLFELVYRQPEIGTGDDVFKFYKGMTVLYNGKKHDITDRRYIDDVPYYELAPSVYVGSYHKIQASQFELLKENTIVRIDSKTMKVKTPGYEEYTIAGDGKFEWVIVNKNNGRIFAAFAYKRDADMFIKDMDSFEVRELVNE